MFIYRLVKTLSRSLNQDINIKYVLSQSIHPQTRGLQNFVFPWAKMQLSKLIGAVR
jgi:hypothetical protein